MPTIMLDGTSKWERRRGWKWLRLIDDLKGKKATKKKSKTDATAVENNSGTCQWENTI